MLCAKRFLPAVCLLAFFVFFGALTMSLATDYSGRHVVSRLTLTTLFDNYRGKPGLKTGWGFSCLVKADDHVILFDTGADDSVLLYNMSQLNIKPADIQTIVLSHIHHDHVGGLDGILKQNNKIIVYLPASFPARFKENVRGRGAKVVEVSQPAKIAPGVNSTGEMGSRIKEQSLLIDTPKGIVVVTGCAHPGIVNIVEEARRLTGKKVYLAVGGFHLFGASYPQLKKIISTMQQLGVARIAPCHCSGDQARELFAQAYGEGYIANGVGHVIEL